MVPVLLVIDVLNDFVDRHEPTERMKLIAATNDLCRLVRNNAGRVIWVRQEFAPDLHDAFIGMRRANDPVTIAGTPGAQLAVGLDVLQVDEVVVKKRYSAFFRTDLDDLLPPPDRAWLIACGVNTHACVRTTVIDAYQRDYGLVIATDATRSYDVEYHNESLRYLGNRIARLQSNLQIKTLLTSGHTDHLFA